MQENELFSMIHAVLELPDGYGLGPETRIDEVPGLDSLGWISLITAIENQTDAEFDLEAIFRLETVADLSKLVQQMNST